MPDQPSNSKADFIVVGSGAGGGTVAARLAEEGFSVLVLEAGGNPRLESGSNPLHPGVNTMPDDYDVPAFHALASENDAMRWDYFVRHYGDDAQQRKDDKYVGDFNGHDVDGIWYPRTGGLGGCTGHNAMILLYPHNTDWNELADLTGDRSWRAERMRTYFERLERCRYRPNDTGPNGSPSRHGFDGWLTTEKVRPDDAIRDPQVRETIGRSFGAALKALGFPSVERLESLGDPNDWRRVAASEVGPCFTPLTTADHRRVGTLDRLLDVHARHPDRLRIETGALATRVLFDGTRAVGVEYLKGDRLYRADPRVSGAAGERHTALAAREVIVSGGAFNTPQLLLLSGIGPAADLEALGIDVLVNLPGVGRNLQDRYEVAVVHRMRRDWDALDGATFSKADAQYADWTHGKGPYATNGVLFSVAARSTQDKPSPDLFCYACLVDFRGYVPGYSKALQETHSALTWLVLKAHTNNTGGTVTLRSADPRDTPVINFKYFDEGTDPHGPDLDAVVSGIRLVRRLTAPLNGGAVVEEVYPGPAAATDEALRAFVRDQAWGHHASCTCAIGLRNRGGVLDGNFRVHGTQGLRVVDASVFPRAPGLFIVSAIYMVGEKAADVILADARATPV